MYLPRAAPSDSQLCIGISSRGLNLIKLKAAAFASKRVLHAVGAVARFFSTSIQNYRHREILKNHMLVYTFV